MQEEIIKETMGIIEGANNREVQAWELWGRLGYKSSSDINDMYYADNNKLYDKLEKEYGGETAMREVNVALKRIVRKNKGMIK